MIPEGTNMNYLVTGSAGFIGFHLSQKLLGKREVVVGIDNLNDYYDVGLKYSRLRELGIDPCLIEYGQPIESEKYPNFIFIELDIKDIDGVKKLFERNFDVVCNLAAQAGVRYSLENPYAYIDSNIVGFINILEMCRKYPVKHLVYASSSSVYGLNTKIPFSTDDNVDHPASLYAATKKSNELMAHTYSHLYDIPTTGLRFFTVYGPWGRPDMAYFLFTEAILKGNPIKIFNNGDMERDFTYVDDIVKGVMKVLDSPPSKSGDLSVESDCIFNSAAPYKLYNIGNSKPVNLLRFIEILESKLGIKANKTYLPMQPGDVKTTYADVEDLIRDFGYRPTTSLEEGIGKFVDWYLQRSGYSQ